MLLMNGNLVYHKSSALFRCCIHMHFNCIYKKSRKIFQTSKNWHKIMYFLLIYIFFPQHELFLNVSQATVRVFEIAVHHIYEFSIDSTVLFDCS